MGSKKSFAFIIPAYNEQHMLPATLQALQKAIGSIDTHIGEIIVVDNNSDDCTSEIAQQLGVGVIFEEIKQIARARNTGAHACPHADYLFFLDADTLISPDLLKASLQKLDSGHLCGGGSRIAFQDGETQLARRIWSCISKFTNLAAGAYIFCLNDAFKDTGGYDQKVYAAEDIIFSRALKKWGRKNGHKKFTILTDFPAITSNRKLEWYSTWHIITMLLLIAIMPWRLRNREKMYFWYSRPQNPLKKHKNK